ncbi:Ig-like domain-containing protein [Rhodococcus sp. NPDC003318]|uniref:Ig-like domain-containing protein n=1 Tax=Rhodococcus sp. NPDC003318 TaxID=3364503 RepID=UPI0036B54ADA
MASNLSGSESAGRGTHSRRTPARRLRAGMFTFGAAAAAIVLMAPPAAAADINTTTTASVQGMVATTCPVTLTATVAPAFTGGTVTFKEGSTAIGAAAAVTNGTASVQHTFSTTGAHVIIATFGGATIGANNFKPSTSAALTLNVATGLNLGSVCLPIGSS